MKEKLQALKNLDSFKIFMQAVDEDANDWHELLKSSTDIVIVYRAQGALQFYEYIKGLIDKLIAEYEEDEEEALGI